MYKITIYTLLHSYVHYEFFENILINAIHMDSYARVTFWFQFSLSMFLPTETNTMDSNLKKKIDIYRDGNFSIMSSEAKNGVLGLFVNDDEKPDRAAKKISIHLLLIGKALDDRRLLRLAVEVLMVDEKTDAIDILLRTREDLEEKEFG